MRPSFCTTARVDVPRPPAMPPVPRADRWMALTLPLFRQLVMLAVSIPPISPPVQRLPAALTGDWFTQLSIMAVALMVPPPTSPPTNDPSERLPTGRFSFTQRCMTNTACASTPPTRPPTKLIPYISLAEEDVFRTRQLSR